MKTLIICLLISFNGYGQKKIYDLISYSLPPAWQEEEGTGGMQLSIHKDGEYAVAVILKGIATDKSALENFHADWQKLVKGTVTLQNEVEMQPPVMDKGWEIYSGTATYLDGSQKGLATFLTASTAGRTVSTVLLTNTARYQDDLLHLLNSLEIQAVNAATPSLSGLWVDYLNETSGAVQGIPSYTGGYFRQEYMLKPNGEYVFRLKNYALLQKDIIYTYEKGSYTLSGNSLILQPSEARSERWSKGPAGKWGERKSAQTASIAVRTYTFTQEQKSQETYLKLQPGNLSFKAYRASMIDTPPANH